MLSTEPTDITIYPKGQEPTRIPASEMLSFDLRLSGYTLAEMLDISKPLGAPRVMDLIVTYTDGRVRRWHVERGVADTQADIPTGIPKLSIRGAIRELTAGAA